MSINNEIQDGIQGHEINQINEISQINDPNDINNETQHGQEGVAEGQNEMHPDLQDLNQTNGMPAFPQNFQPQDFQPQHPGQHMMWNNQFMPPQMGRPNGPPFPFGIPSPFAPYQNFPPYRMKPPEMGSFYHDGVSHDGSPFKGGSPNRGGKNMQSGVKYRHNESEQRRRDKINHHFDELKLLLPSHRNNKSAILEAAIEYIKKYQVQIQQLEKLNLDIARENNDIIQILAQVNDFNQRRLETQ